MLRRVNSSLRALGRDSGQTLPFENPAEIPSLVHQWVCQGKEPRIEFVAEILPVLPKILPGLGFNLESTAPILVHRREKLPGPAVLPLGFSWVSLDGTDEVFLRRYLENQNRTFGGREGEGLEWLPFFRRGLVEGTVIGEALVYDNEFVGGGIIQIGEGLGEMAGVWTDTRFRGRGFARSLVQRLLSSYYDRGFTEAWLSAAEGAINLYEKVGFMTAGTQLNYFYPLDEKRIWSHYLRYLGEDPQTTSVHYRYAEHFCYDKDCADHLFDLVGAGKKRATCGNLWMFEHTREPILEPGDLTILTNFDGTRACVLRTTGIIVKKFKDVTPEEASREGEGDRSLEYWRRVHTEFFGKECAEIGRSFTEDLPVVFEDFEVVFPVQDGVYCTE